MKRLWILVLVFSLCFIPAVGAEQTPTTLVGKSKQKVTKTAKSGKSAKSVKKAQRSPKKNKAVASRAASRSSGDISARCAVVMDAASGAILFERNGTEKRQPASTIKILTGLIAIDELNNSEKVPVSSRAEGMPRSKVYLRAGKQYKADDLINSVLLASANDASVALAEKISGSETAFARKMTEKAGELGARSTQCRTANGLTAPGQYSTARDLAVMFNAAMKNREFADRMARSKVRTSFGQTLSNHNRALWQIEGALGGKTGFTQAARQTYVGKFRRNGQDIVVAIMGSGRMWEDIPLLVNKGFQLAGKSDDRQQSAVEQLAQLRRQLHRENELSRLEILTPAKKVRPGVAL